MAYWLPSAQSSSQGYYTTSQVANAAASLPVSGSQPPNAGAAQNQGTTNFEQDCLIAGGSVLATTLIGTGLYLGLRKQDPAQILISTPPPDGHPFFALEHKGMAAGFPKYLQPSDQGLCGFATAMTLLEGRPLKNGKELHSALMEGYHIALADREMMKRPELDRLQPEHYTECLSAREFTLVYNHLLEQLQETEAVKNFRPFEKTDPHDQFGGASIRGNIPQNDSDPHIDPTSREEKFKIPGPEKGDCDLKDLGPHTVDRFAVLYKRYEPGSTMQGYGHWVSIVKHHDDKAWYCHDSADASATRITDDNGTELPGGTPAHTILDYVVAMLRKEAGSKSVYYEVAIPRGYLQHYNSAPVSVA